ncbi:MAG TPA: serine protease [Bacteroidales bacterium]|nr:serine protease [Bacteroidales bacterium]
MYREVWKKYHGAICAIEFFGSSGSRIFGLTGFRTGQKIVTDDMLYNIKGAQEVVISFYREDGMTVSSQLKMGYHELLYILPDKEDFDELGFSIIPADFPEFRQTTSLELCRNCSPNLGQEAVTLAYQREYNNMSIKSALVSSCFKNEQGLSFIQYDGTVKPGSSGGPLIDVVSGTVLGITSTKEMSVVKNYRKLTNIIENNLQLLKSEEGKWQINDIDPIQVLIANQNQIKHVAKEFFKNSTVRIGFALDIGHLIDYLEGSFEFDFDLNAVAD